MADFSFDVVSDFDQQELVNALDQVRREIATRYDFKGSKSSLELGKAVRRGLSLKIFDWGKLEPAAGGTVRQVIGLRKGLNADQGRELSRHVREQFPKVKVSI